MQLALSRSKKVAHPRHGAPSTLQEGALDFGLLTETECSSSLRGSKRISETDRELTPEYVPWSVDSSPQAVKCSFLLALILARWTGHLTAMVSTLNTAKGTRRERPPRGGQPPAKTMWPSAEWG